MSRQRFLTRGVWATIRVLPKASRVLTAAVALVMVIGALEPAAFRLVTGIAVGTLPSAMRDGAGSSAAHRVTPLLLGAGALFAIGQINGPVMNAVSNALGIRLNTHLRGRAMAATLGPAGIGHLEDPAVLDQLAIAQGVAATDVGPAQVAAAIPVIGTRYLSSLVSAAMLAFYNLWFALGLLVAFLVIIGRFRAAFQASSQVLIGKAENMRRSAYMRDAAMTAPAAKETRVFGMRDWIERRYMGEWRTAIDEARRSRRGSWRLIVWSPIVFFAIDMAMVVVLGRAAVHGEISLGEFTVYLQAAMGIGVLGSLSQHDIWLQHGVPSIVAALELERMAASPERQLSGSASPAGLPARSIAFEGVTFRYPGQTRTVLDGLDLEIRAGESLAIVGDNGAGKTTLVKLLTRLYDPTAGRIAVDGTDLREFDPAAWQRRIGAIFQDFVRYQLPATDNVGFGASTAADLEALRSAATRAGALELIDGLDNGWDTVLSRQFTGGTDLSGGQWQRVALARALYAVEQGAGVLVLDEPSANLDVRAEADLYDRFLDLTAGLTTVLISHRFSTVRRADRIVVLEGGRVVEDGTHDDLIAAGGRYAHMFELQAARFG
jgi:ATP-binding cassette subfamily B protein